MRRRARPGSARVACMRTAFLAGAVLLASAGLAGCAGVSGTALPTAGASRPSAAAAGGPARRAAGTSTSEPRYDGPDARAESRSSCFAAGTGPVPAGLF